MLPFGQPTEMGKLTVIKAGPGFHEEKHFDIGPNGKLTEVEPIQMHDAREYNSLLFSCVHFIYNQQSIQLNMQTPWTLISIPMMLKFSMTRMKTWQKIVSLLLLKLKVRK